MVKEICLSIKQRVISEEVLYILKAAIISAAYDDTRGLSAISMFLELTARIFSLVSQHLDQFETLKKVFLFSPSRLIPHLRNIHQFITVLLQDFINVAIALNQRSKQEHPDMQMLIFSYQMVVKYGLIE